MSSRCLACSATGETALLCYCYISTRYSFLPMAPAQTPGERAHDPVDRQEESKRRERALPDRRGRCLPTPRPMQRIGSCRRRNPECCRWRARAWTEASAKVDVTYWHRR